MKTQLIATVIVALVTIGATYQQGVISDRWTREIREKLVNFSASLDKVYDPKLGDFVPNELPTVPTQVGNWVSEDVPVDTKQFAASGCHGVVSRAYRNAVNGQQVTIFLVSGKAYHLTIHTPDWCYVAAGFTMENKPANYEFEAPGMETDPEVLHALFRKEEPTVTRRLRVLWGYSEDGVWTAPKLAEHMFAGKPALYKIYIIASAEGAVPQLGSEEDSTISFAKEFLPKLNEVLFQDAVPANPSATPLAVTQ